MLARSIYFNPRGGRPGVISPQGVDIDAAEFPGDWFEGLHEDQYKARRYVNDRNKYKVRSLAGPLHCARVEQGRDTACRHADHSFRAAAVNGGAAPAVKPWKRVVRLAGARRAEARVQGPRGLLLWLLLADRSSTAS